MANLHFQGHVPLRVMGRLYTQILKGLEYLLHFARPLNSFLDNGIDDFEVMDFQGLYGFRKTKFKYL